MTLNAAQYLAPLNSQQVLTGYAQGVKEGTGVTILPNGEITLNPTESASLGFLVSLVAPAPVYTWPTAVAAAGAVLLNNGSGTLSWSTGYVSVVPAGSTFPHTGAALLPVGNTGNRPANQAGLFRYNSILQTVEFSTATTWVPLPTSVGTGANSYVQATAPSAIAVGDLWYDTSISREKVWTGATWVLTVPDVIGSAGGESNLGVSTITDNLTSTATDSALSANMGVQLLSQIQARGYLSLAGSINALNGFMEFVTPEANAIGFAIGNPLTVASPANNNYFAVVVDGPGVITPPGGFATAVNTGDWFLSQGTYWQYLPFGPAPSGSSSIVYYDDISPLFNGATQDFPLEIGGILDAPNPSTNLTVFLAGVPQTPGATNSYTVSGSTISFTEAPVPGATFYAFTVR